MLKRAKRIPKFRNEAEERKFWETHDTEGLVDWSTAQRVRFPNLKPSTKSISLRLPLSLLEQIKVEANKRDVPYQSLIKVWLAEKVS
jgi:predicted DNA binding CopG/RHH family protein